MFLEMEERVRFAAWLRQDAADNRLLAKKMGELSLGPAVSNMLVEHKVLDADAEERVANILVGNQGGS